MDHAVTLARCLNCLCLLPTAYCLLRGRAHPGLPPSAPRVAGLRLLVPASVRVELYSPCAEADGHRHHPRRIREPRGRPGLGVVGGRDPRGRLGQHRRHRRDCAAPHRSRRRARMDRLLCPEEPRGRRGVARLDPVARRGRAGDAGACDGDPGPAARSNRRARVPDAAARASTWGGGSARPTGIRTTSSGSTIAAYRRWVGRPCTKAVEVDGPVGRLRARPAALSLPRHRASPADHRPLHHAGRAPDAPSAADGRRGGPGRASPAGVPAELRGAGRVARRRPGLRGVAAQQLLRHAEVREALGSRAAERAASA